MECPYCSASTSVSNSRPTAKGQMVWRRRTCGACEATFTTHEQIDASGAVMVATGTDLRPFSRDRLFLSIYRALEHKDESPATASEITQTVITNILKRLNSAKTNPGSIASVTRNVLANFDAMAALKYAPDYLSSQDKKELAKKLG